MNDKQTQIEQIEGYMANFGSITPLEAMQDLGCMRLASRISDMKKLGMPIKTEYIQVNNRFGKKTRIARYSFE